MTTGNTSASQAKPLPRYEFVKLKNKLLNYLIVIFIYCNYNLNEVHSLTKRALVTFLWITLFWHPFQGFNLNVYCSLK